MATPSERAALEGAANAVRVTRWTKPDKQDLSARLSGIVVDQTPKFTRENAVVEYIALLNREADPKAALYRDVQSHLKALDALIVTAQETVTALDPRLDDVDVLETSISDLRETRSIYLSALKYFERESVDASVSLQRRSVKAAFNARLSALGTTADDLADRAHGKRKASLAAKNR